MAEEKYEILLNSELNNHQIYIAMDLACSLRADEIETFLQTYDSIPESVGSKQINQIKEMARQLAALPMKQFDMYRTKVRFLVAGDHLNSPITLTVNVKENIRAFDTSNHVTDVCRNEEVLEMKTTPGDTDENKDVGVKSKKSSKKKKKNKAVLLEETPGISHVETSNKNSKDSSENQGILMTQKLLDPSNQSTSRIATMNRTLVSDICCSNSQGMNSDNASNEIWTTKSQDDIHSKEKRKQKTKEENCSYEINDSHNHPSFPPFGFPLSASKLIQSAIELLPSSSAATSNDSEHSGKQNQDKNYAQQEHNTSGHVRQSTGTSVVSKINGSLKLSGDQISSKKCEPWWETGSVDGDTSNLSAVEDDGGWQSQVRRSSRKKKKELDGRITRERNQTDNKNKRSFQKDNNKTSNFKKQHFKNSSNRNPSGTFKEISKKYSPNNAAKESKDKELSSRSKYEEKGRKQGNAAELSYRDALLKTKPKPPEELQYNSDSGVDVNSVGSCDSTIHSSKSILGFDVNEAVKFLIKGCDEVQKRHKQGGVHYYSP